MLSELFNSFNLGSPTLWDEPIEALILENLQKYTDLFAMSPGKVCILIARILVLVPGPKLLRVLKMENAFKILIMPFM